MNTSSGNRRLTADKSGYRHYDDDGDGEAQSGRWLISYADLVTTLMVLFLALYALQLAKNRELEIKALARHEVKAETATVSTHAPGVPDAARRQLLSLLAPLQDNRQITISNASQGVEIAINAKVLFNSGDARLLPESFEVLDQIAKLLRDRSKNNILVEGHTDSVPISTAKYESNWELSSARAGAVVRFFADKGIEPHRMAAIGRADNFPLIIGDDAAARAANRRVTILVEY
ncbi:Motility protein B [Paraburkholderia domus]|jgi:Flagellar motor protein|uniref:Motility protein B n=1 Tax=Paraburkholderia domus TaxID=2793075 RepID=A0A9N8R2X8_9BURK|nr:OmpA family protein [Paraburkholderia domus]MBK5050293.1 OmpA family protein [Burkholderia sp. R-70006]MBK5062420.1 OmpA family protein [Burkholderia sp. R-70199]MBK5089295.1 OmpA family protein [Burkholderia sp. R-69927]MBK5118903.1 OmpA family protein [Burkholderia sp. R-69980]MBK5168066.1 OmpA family protein [Burkholderia sp. R-70211]MBK5183368.1 OmpA family protein [Burkholderia sp. R-69749]MCI0144932.1 OmpA family protein [Paraburkholderia sediminicola]